MSKGSQMGSEKKEKPNASSFEHKKDEHQKPESFSQKGQKGKGVDPATGACLVKGCKAHASRFSFCTEHYDHFKFGLITKHGEQVSDYEKKFEHYAAYQAKQKESQKLKRAA